MSHGHRRQKRAREPWRDDPSWEPRFNDPQLQAAYEESRAVLDAHRDRAVWTEDETSEPKAR